MTFGCFCNEQVILVGHSLGGGVIAYASEIYPHKVSKAIYLSACMPTYHQSMFSAFPNDVIIMQPLPSDSCSHCSEGCLYETEDVDIQDNITCTLPNLLLIVLGSCSKSGVRIELDKKHCLGSLYI